MSESPVKFLDGEGIEEAAKVARLLVKPHIYRAINEDYGAPTRYELADDLTMVEMATDIVNGEHEQFFEYFSYDSEDWTEKDFVEQALEASSTPYSGDEPFSEMKGSTQLGDEPVDNTRKDRNFREVKFSEMPGREGVDRTEDEKWIEGIYDEPLTVVRFDSYRPVWLMADVVEPDPDVDSREEVYWPE